MITITVRDAYIRIEGHSGYAPPGTDIVCSAISTLTQTLISSMQALTKDTITYQLAPGDGQISYGSLSEAGKALVDSFFIGCSMVADAYPDHVQIV